jgi:hypothetical protein
MIKQPLLAAAPPAPTVAISTTAPLRAAVSATHPKGPNALSYVTGFQRG